MFTRLALATCLILSATALPVSANDSVYTDLDTDRCKKLSVDEESGGIVLECKGLKGHPVIFKEGDLRQAVQYGAVSKAYIDGVFESFGPFNHVGDKIEWRLGPGGKPVAAIQRWFISNSDSMEAGPAPANKGQVLVVSRVAGTDGQSCVVGYVDALANPEPNLLARQVADDDAADFACGTDEAIFHGQRGPFASAPTHSFAQ